jgi:DNA-binding response OmpR family regulator
VRDTQAVLAIVGDRGDCERLAARLAELGVCCRVLGDAGLASAVSAHPPVTAAPATVGLLRVGPVEIDTTRREARVDGGLLVLRRREFDLLVWLAREPARVFTREELFEGVWGYGELPRSRTLDTHASRLRRALAARGVRMVVNVWGVGYALAPGGGQLQAGRP